MQEDEDVGPADVEPGRGQCPRGERRLPAVGVLDDLTVGIVPAGVVRGLEVRRDAVLEGEVPHLVDGEPGGDLRV